MNRLNPPNKELAKQEYVRSSLQMMTELNWTARDVAKATGVREDMIQKALDTPLDCELVFVMALQFQIKSQYDRKQ